MSEEDGAALLTVALLTRVRDGVREVRIGLDWIKHDPGNRIRLDHPQAIGPQASHSRRMVEARDDWRAGRLRYAGSDWIGGHLLHYWEVKSGSCWLPAETRVRAER